MISTEHALRVKEQERSVINDQIARFLAQGGKIKVFGTTEAKLEVRRGREFTINASKADCVKKKPTKPKVKDHG